MKKVIKSIYSPPRKNHLITLREFYQANNQVIYFSLARHALKKGLALLGLKAGDFVLLPSFICRDVLAPFNELGIKIYFYEVDENLKPIHLENQMKVKAIFAIHYFGFENDLDPFLDYCKKNSAFLIEDNAHGLLSKSAQGVLLGEHGDVGIISARKSLPIENGALLIYKSLQEKLEQSAIQPQGSLRLKIKKMMRFFVSVFGIKFFLLITKLKRLLRKLVYGNEVPLSTDLDETVVPMDPNPIDIDEYFLTVDIEKEKLRRRELFTVVGNVLKNDSIRPFKEELGDGEVPYGFPFFCSLPNLPAVKEKLEDLNLEIVNWPALPTAVLEKGVPDFYKNLYIVKFLW